MANFYFSNRATFQAAHAVILNDIDRIREHARDYHKAHMMLQEFDIVLCEYFKAQDGAFYEKFGVVANLKIIEFLARDIQDLKIDWLAFMDRFPSNAHEVRVRNFPREFLEFSNKVRERLFLEQDQIFPLLAGKNKKID